MPTFIQRFQAAFKGFSFGSFGGGYGANDPWGGFYRTLPGSQYDYKNEAGIVWENSVVLACVKWASRCFPEAPLIAQRYRGGEWKRMDDHPALALIAKPNPYYDSSLLFTGAVLSTMVDGNGYWFVNPSKLGNPAELYYVPHFSVSPKWGSDGNAFISHYEYRVDAAKTVNWPVEQVVHFRDGVDPQNIRRGLSPLGAALREICADNEAATASAALMRNMGVLGITFTPVEGTELTDVNREKLQALGQQKMTGERRGEFMVSSIPGKWETLGFDPKKLALDVIRRLPEERITALLGIPAVVVGLGAGLDRSTFANFQEAREAAYESFLVPMWRTMASQMTRVLMPLYGDDPMKVRLAFDETKVKALQDDHTERNDRLIALFLGDLITRNEAREAIDFPPSEGGDVYHGELTQTTEPGNAPQPEEDQPK